jgi:hypothetical protein
LHWQQQFVIDLQLALALAHRAPGPLTQSIGERVRVEILASARERGLTPFAVWTRYLDHDGHAIGDLALRAIARRYGLAAEALERAWQARLGDVRRRAGDNDDLVLAREGARIALLVLPDEEFLRAFEHAARDHDEGYPGEHLLDRAGRILREYRPPWAISHFAGVRWTGDEQRTAEALRCAAEALHNPRLAAARMAYAHALRARRTGGVGPCREAVELACEAVVATIRAVLSAADQPARGDVYDLAGQIVRSGVLSESAFGVITATESVRSCGGTSANAGELASHALAAAAVAIVFLAERLPSAPDHQ